MVSSAYQQQQKKNLAWSRTPATLPTWRTPGRSPAGAAAATQGPPGRGRRERPRDERRRRPFALDGVRAGGWAAAGPSPSQGPAPGKGLSQGKFLPTSRTYLEYYFIRKWWDTAAKIRLHIHLKWSQIKNIMIHPIPSAGPTPATATSVEPGAGLRAGGSADSPPSPPRHVQRRIQSRSRREREAPPPLPRRRADSAEGEARGPAVASHERGAGRAVGGQGCSLWHLPAVSVVAPALPSQQGFRARLAPVRRLSAVSQ